jgi:hypothetical protein
MEMYARHQLLKDIDELIDRSRKESYGFGGRDIFAIGFVAGKYGLTKLINNKEEVIKACEAYDETDDLKLLDTVKECLMDLDIIPGAIRGNKK